MQCVCVCVCVCDGMHVEVRGQHLELVLYGLWIWLLGCQVWVANALPTEAKSHPISCHFNEQYYYVSSDEMKQMFVFLLGCMQLRIDVY